MAEINRIRCSWTGWNGQPGVSTFYFSGTDYAAVGALATFWDSLKTSIPNGITITTPGSGDIIDEATGALTGQWTHSADHTTACTGSGNWVAGVGALFRWHTSTIHNGRRLQGHTFVVPLVAASYDSTGQLIPTDPGTLGGAGNTLISNASNELVVWGRPKAGAGGIAGQMTTCTVPLKVAMLRSRRD